MDVHHLASTALRHAGMRKTRLVAPFFRVFALVTRQNFYSKKYSNGIIA